MQVIKKITKNGGFTIPRGISVKTGIMPGTPVNITADTEGIHITKHVPTCFYCGTIANVHTVCDIEICKECAVKIMEAFEA